MSQISGFVLQIGFWFFSSSKLRVWLRFISNKTSAQLSEHLAFDHFMITLSLNL
jgi:hypothetical protein